MIIGSKKATLLPLGYLKYMPKKFLPTFYAHVCDIVGDIEDEAIVDSIVVFKDQVSETIQSLNYDSKAVTKELHDMCKRANQFWTNTRLLLRAYQVSADPAEATLAKKALALLDNVEKGRLLVSNAGKHIESLVASIDAAWTKAELQTTFLGKWRDQLETLATDYGQMMDRHVKDGANHVCFSERRDDLFASFDFLYLNLYTYVGNTGDLNISQKFSELNDLIAWYTATAKAHSTRVRNANANVNVNDNDNANDNANANEKEGEEVVDESATLTLTESPDTSTSEAV